MAVSNENHPQSPASLRGFCVDSEDSARRLYLIPRGMTNGAAAKRAVSSGLAERLGAGDFSFDHVDILTKAPGKPGERRPCVLKDIPAIARPLLDGLRAPQSDFAGLSLDRVRMMGVVNVTPDSFSDGGEFLDHAAAIAHGCALIEAGADILDVGGESTRPGATPVSIEEESRRVLPVIEGLASRNAVVSIDTRHAEIMRRAIEAGARIINDVTALGDPKAQAIAAESGAAIILMHMQGEPATMQHRPFYEDVTAALLDYFDERLQVLERRGIRREQIAIDPGIGFGKDDRHNLQLFDELAAFHVFGCPVAIGASRTGLIARLSRGEEPKERVAGSLALHQWAMDRGARIVRVHDVAEAAQARALWESLSSGYERAR